MLAFEDRKKSPAMIKVVGVGGGGMNAVERMVSMNLEGVELIVMNTDEQVLEKSHASIKVALGSKITRGMGAGGRPEMGAQAALEDREKIMNVLKGADMVFITAGMGGGTGTGAAPIVAEVARELKALTVGVVTLPFIVEGHKRMENAKQGQSNLRERVDTLITIPNEAIFKVIDKKTPVNMAFRAIDDMLCRAVRGISNIINSTGFVNVDFADVRTVMGQNGDAVIGMGEGTGENRVAEAIQAAIHHPLLNGKTIDGAQSVLINVVGGADLSLYEYHEIQKQIHEQISKDAVMIVGFTEDESKDNQVSITVIATGFRKRESMSLDQPRMVQSQPHVLSRTGTDDVPRMNHATQQGTDFPRVDASIQSAAFEIPTFLRKMPKLD